MSIFTLFKKDRETEKEEVVTHILGKIINSHYNFDHGEQTEILNRLQIRLFERKKETRSKLITEAREVMESMTAINI